MKPGVLLDMGDIARLSQGLPLMIDVPAGGLIGISLDLTDLAKPKRGRVVRKAKTARRGKLPQFAHGANCAKCGKNFEWPGQIQSHRDRGECKGKKGR